MGGDATLITVRLVCQQEDSGERMATLLVFPKQETLIKSGGPLPLPPQAGEERGRSRS